MIGMPRIPVNLLQIASIAALAASLSGCGSEGSVPMAGATSAEQSEAVATLESGPPVTVEEGREFARKMIGAIYAADAASLNELISWDAIIEKASAGIDAGGKFEKEFLQGVKKGAAKRCDEKLIGLVQAGGSIRRLHIREVDGGKSALFRAVSADEGLTYYDTPLARQTDGKIRAVDFYGFASAELLSQTIRHSFLRAIAERPGLLARTTGFGNELEQSAILTMDRISAAQKAGEHQQAFQLYGTLPATFKKGKVAQMAHMAIARSLDDQQYLAAMDECRALFPDDPGIDLISIDYFILRKRYEEALICIDRVDTIVDDPFLDAVRASVYLEDGKSALAAQAADRAIQRDPDEPRSYWVRVEISLREMKFADTVRVLASLRKRLNVEAGDLTQQDAYAAFVRSPEYKAWMKSQASTSAPNQSEQRHTAASGR